MRTAKTNRIRPAFLTLSAVVTLGVVLTATAGEPIRFSGDKSKPMPNAPDKFPKERLSTLDSIPATSPLDGLNGAAPNSRRMSLKDEKRLKNAKLEKENWAMVNQGDLQNEGADDEGFGIRDYGGETLEKEKGSGDIWFGNNSDRGGKSAGQSRASGNTGRQANSSRSQSAPQAAPASRSDNEIRFGPSKGPDFDVSSAGKGSSKESFQPGTPSVDPNSALRELINGPAGARSGAEPDRSRESFGLRSINSQPAASGLNRGYGLNLESSRATPAPSRSMIEGPRSQPGGLSGSGSSPLNSALNSSRLDANGPARSAVSPLNQPRQEYAPTSTRDLFAPPSRPGGR